MKRIILLLFGLLLLAGCAISNQNRIDQLEKDLVELRQTRQLEEDIRAASKSGAKWSTYASLGASAIADGDDFMVRDISDTSPWATGEQKLYTWSNLKSDLESISEFGFPYGPTLSWIDTKAEAGLDDTDDQLIIYGAAARVFTYKHRECFTLEDPADADDNVPIFSLDDGFTVTRLDCIVSGGTSAVMVLNDGTNNLDSMTCATTETSDAAMSGNNVFTALEKMELDVGTVTGAVDWVRMCFSYTITRE